MAELSVSLFAADIMQVGKDLDSFRRMDIDSLHIDVMDGHFVPLFGYNQMWIKEIMIKMKMNADIHLMAYLNDEILDRFLELKPSELSFHIEAQDAELTVRYLYKIKAAGVRCGLAVSPDTPCERVSRYLEITDFILVMTTYPGCEGSTFLESSYQRVERIREIIRKSGKHVSICVDGGQNKERAEKIIRKGADKVIIGRAFYQEPDKLRLINDIHNL